MLTQKQNSPLAWFSWEPSLEISTVQQRIWFGGAPAELLDNNLYKFIYMTVKIMSNVF